MPRPYNRKPMAQPSPELAVETRALRRVYRSRGEEIVALQSVDLQVHRGRIYGVLGPNGAGKTTLIKILVTLLLPSGGEAYVDGLNVVTEFRKLRHRIAMVSGGENSGYGLLKVREQLWLFSQLYGLPSKEAHRRIDELLERLGLAEVAGRKVSSLSSGMRQKMNLIRGLVSDPKILFLDEPTVALDVGAARDMREEVQRWVADDPSRTVILTTHYMMEADELCARVAIVNRGRVIAEGAPAALKQRVREHVIIDLIVGRGEPLLPALRAVEGVTGASAQEEDGADHLSVILADDSAMPRVLATVERSGRSIQGVQKREPSLEDAFVTLVGRSMSEEEGE